MADLNKRSRTFMFLLYPDNEKHCQALEYIQSHFHNYAFALHDKDVYDEDNSETGTKVGELKKAHWHVVIKLSEARTRSAIIKDMRDYITELNIIPFNSLKSALLYLVHAENEEKYQYDKNVVEGSLKSDFLGYYSKVGLNDSEILNEIYSFIISRFPCSLSSVFEFCISMGYTKIYRSYYNLIKDIVFEHNKNMC